LHSLTALCFVLFDFLGAVQLQLCNQELRWSGLLSSSHTNDMEVDVVGAVIDLSPELSKRYLLLLDITFLFM